MFDPQHQQYFEPENPAPGWPAPRASLYYPKGADQLHATGGVGVVIRRLRIDLGFSAADVSNTFALSTGFAF